MDIEKLNWTTTSRKFWLVFQHIVCVLNKHFGPFVIPLTHRSDRTLWSPLPEIDECVQRPVLWSRPPPVQTKSRPQTCPSRDQVKTKTRPRRDQVKTPDLSWSRQSRPRPKSLDAKSKTETAKSCIFSEADNRRVCKSFKTTIIILNILYIECSLHSQADYQKINHIWIIDDDTNIKRKTLNKRMKRRQRKFVRF